MRHPSRPSRRSQTGLTLLEVVIAMALLVGVLGSAMTLLDTSRALSQSVQDQQIANARVDRALALISDEFRKGSLATAQHPDGSTFSDGDTDTGFQIQPVTGWNGTAVLGDAVTYQFIRAVGATEGELIRDELGVETLMVREITSFSVTRSGNAFVFTVTAESGYQDDRRRTASGTLRVMARNP